MENEAVIYVTASAYEHAYTSAARSTVVHFGVLQSSISAIRAVINQITFWGGCGTDISSTSAARVVADDATIGGGCCCCRRWCC